MDFTLKRFSIIDITHHAEIASATGKVTFQFVDPLPDARGLDQFVVVDVSIPAADNDTIEHLKHGLLLRAMQVLQSALRFGDAPPEPFRVPQGAKVN